MKDEEIKLRRDKITEIEKVLEGALGPEKAAIASLFISDANFTHLMIDHSNRLVAHFEQGTEEMRKYVTEYRNEELDVRNNFEDLIYRIAKKFGVGKEAADSIHQLTRLIKY